MTVIAVAENALDPALLEEAAHRVDSTITLGPVRTPEDIATLTEGADALLVTLQPLRAEHIAALPDSVTIISRAGVGLDTVDVGAARERGIAVVFQPSYATAEVADHAAAMALSAWRRLPAADDLMRHGWGAATSLGAVRSLQESTLGVLGAGRIGRAVIERLRPFVARVLAFDVSPQSELAGVEWVDSVSEVLRRSNLVTMHLPLDPRSRHVIDATALATMPTGAVLVNVSRGGLIDEDALVDALHSGALGGAALDVFESEPLPPDSRLRSAPNLLLSPHVAWFSVDSAARLTRWSVEDAARFAQSGAIVNGHLA